MDSSERGKLLGKVADIIRKRKDELAMLDTLDCGKPISDTTEVMLKGTTKIVEEASKKTIDDAGEG